MICKFCNAEIDEGLDVCPVCGETLSEETVSEQEQTPKTAAEEETEGSANDSEEAVFCENNGTEEEASEGSEDSENDEDEYKGFAFTDVQPARPKKTWKLVVGIVAAVIGMSVLALLLLIALGVEIKLPSNDIYRKDKYSVSDEKAVDNADRVVATMGDAKLTNAQLEIYYRLQVQEFVSYYGSYLSYIGFDYTQPLSEQTCYYDDTMTWEQYFIDVAIKTWQNYQALGLQATQNGFVLDETWETELAAIPDSLQEQAVASEFTDADAYLKDILGPACSIDEYMIYVRLNALGYEYYASEYDKIQPTDEEIEAYFTEHEAEFAESGITKESLAASVRHILVCPEGGTLSDDGYTTTYSDEEWAACLTKAEGILQEWKDGEATEESFADMVATYTEDTGSAATGGLYEGITATSNYVENFLNWAVDTGRQPGDTDIVQTEYGYHIMYYVSGEVQWIGEATTQLMAERGSALVDAAKENFPMKVYYSRIAIAELEMS